MSKGRQDHHDQPDKSHHGFVGNVPTGQQDAGNNGEWKCYAKWFSSHAQSRDARIPMT